MSVVIAALNAAATLPLQLSALAAQDFAGSWEVVVADNGSTDDTVGVAREFASVLPQLTVVDASSRGGQSYARNVALRAARGDLIACCDADDRVTTSWLSALVAASAQHDIVAGPILVGAGADLEPTEATTPDGAVLALGFAPFAPGGSMMALRRLLLRIGGWDESFALAGAEDVDLSWRAVRAGATLGFAREALVWVREREGTRALFRQHFYRGRSDVLLYARYRHDGLRRRPAKTMVYRWLSRVRSVPAVYRDVAVRRDEVRRLALDAGRLYQSARSRTLYW